MTPSQNHQEFEQVARNIEPHGKLLRVWSLQGGISAQVTALEIARPDGQVRKVVVRQHGAADLQSNPNVAADEFRLLHMLQSAGLPVPAPFHLDQSGEIFPTPYLVIEFVEGSPDDAPNDLPLQLATSLARIHQIKSSLVPFLPDQEKRVTEMLRERPGQPDDSLEEGRIRDALESVWPIPRQNNAALLHGDFWPGNLLWHEGELAAILDWEDAAIGDPLADIANMRLEILWAAGREATAQLTEHYQSITSIDFANLPYWDLYAALRPAGKLSTWGLDSLTEQRMREHHHLFVAQAFDKLNS